MKTPLFYRANLIALAFGCLVALSCSTGNLTGQIVKETRNVSAVEGVALAFSGDVYITQGSAQKVEIEAEKSTLEIIETKVDVLYEDKETKLASLRASYILDLTNFDDFVNIFYL